MKGFGDLYKEKKKKTQKTKTSNEQIINQAIQFHLKGNIKEATKYYQILISKSINNPGIYSNYGAILHSQGKLKDAEFSYRKAIEINPNFADAYSNLGNVLRDLGKLQDAELSTRKAIELNPHFANAHFNLGGILNNLGKSQEAFDSYLNLIEINPTYPNLYLVITEFLKNIDSSKLNQSKSKNILNLLLEMNDVSHQKLFNIFNFLYKDEISRNLGELSSDFSKNKSIFNSKILITALKKMIFSNFKLELLLRETRSHICVLISNKRKDSMNHNKLEFIIALGEQCFLNEYVYSISKEEKKCADLIIDRCKNGELNELNISILSCYFPLYKLLDQIPSLTSFNSSNQSFNELIELQITEPIKEIELSKDINKLGSINNHISQKVKCQYEENPYPRWRYGNHQKDQKISIIQAVNNEINPNYIRQNIDNNQLKVLIAGCGTGNQILQTQRYKNTQITAIDLSLSSLSYAQRKINELKIDNVELIQMDILEVGLLKEQFDIIECSGVLHHMNKPSEGLKTLLRVLRNNGYLKLGLYSELARKDVVKARKYIASKNLQANEDSIRDFRETIFSGKKKELNSLLDSPDFYSLSSCRDLCFHIKEHRFTIEQLQETLKSNQLNFLGFILPQAVKSLYENYFPKDKKQTNLQNWATFEEKHPKTFASMYEFWVSKIEN